MATPVAPPGSSCPPYVAVMKKWYVVPLVRPVTTLSPVPALVTVVPALWSKTGLVLEVIRIPVTPLGSPGQLTVACPLPAVI